VEGLRFAQISMDH